MVKALILNVLLSDLFGINCATGMSALMRKELLDNKGGFEAFSCYLAEDFFFAQAVQVVVSDDVDDHDGDVVVTLNTDQSAFCRSKTTSWQSAVNLQHKIRPLPQSPPSTVVFQGDGEDHYDGSSLGPNTIMATIVSCFANDNNYYYPIGAAGGNIT